MDEIDRLRARIDEIDREILIRLKARSENAAYIGNVKRSRRIPIRAPKREEELLRGIGKNASTLGLDPAHTRNVFREIMKLAVHTQRSSSKRRLDNVPLSNLRCLVVGGTGEMGRLFVHMLRSEGAHVGIVGHTKSSTIRTASEIGAEPGKVEDARDANVVIVSVPIAETRDVATKAASHMPDGSLLSDLSSVKQGISNQIAKATRSTIEYVSIHPLFGPQPTSVHGQNLLVLPYRTGKLWRRLAEAFEGMGLTISVITEEEHDRAMSYVQGMHHFALVALGSGLARWDGNYKTNSLKLTLRRIQAVSESPSTISAIQNFNPYSRRARTEFLDSARRLTHNPGDFENALVKVSYHVQKWSRKR